MACVALLAAPLPRRRKSAAHWPSHQGRTGRTQAKNYDEARPSCARREQCQQDTYDQYVINEFLGPVYARQNKFAEAPEAYRPMPIPSTCPPPAGGCYGPS
jgi:hypothetical protein